MLYGVVSFGIGCTNASFPEAYAKIDQHYWDWIKDNKEPEAQSTVGETSTDNLQIWLLLVDEDDESQNKMMLSENPDVEEFSGEQHSLSYLKSSFAF